MATRMGGTGPLTAAAADARVEVGVVGDEELRLVVLSRPADPETDQVALTLRGVRRAPPRASPPPPGRAVDHGRPDDQGQGS